MEKEKALQFASQAGESVFQWLAGVLLQVDNVVINALGGRETLKGWKLRLLTIIERYAPLGMYNMD